MTKNGHKVSESRGYFSAFTGEKAGELTKKAENLYGYCPFFDSKNDLTN